MELTLHLKISLSECKNVAHIKQSWCRFTFSLSFRFSRNWRVSLPQVGEVTHSLGLEYSELHCTAQRLQKPLFSFLSVGSHNGQAGDKSVILARCYCWKHSESFSSARLPNVATASFYFRLQKDYYGASWSLKTFRKYSFSRVGLQLSLVLNH